MDYREIDRKVQESMAGVLALGAAGAELRLRQTGMEADPRMRGALQAIVSQLDVGMLEGLEPGQMASLVGFITYALQEALNLIREPERAPGWTYTDPAILQERGRSSRGAALLFRALAESRPVLRSVLENDCRFLDVGSGVAWLSIQAAQIWQSMRITGLDIHDPALALAAENIAEAGLADRISIRRQSITEITDDKAFDLVWFPSMFMPADVVRQAIPRIHRALSPGGMLVFAVFAPPPGPFGETIRDLLTIRSGGHPWPVDELEALLTSAGFDELEFVRNGTAASTMLARRKV